MAYTAGRWPAAAYWTVVLLTLSCLVGVVAVAVTPWMHTPSGRLATFVPADGTRTSDAGWAPAGRTGGEAPSWWENSVLPAELGEAGLPTVARELWAEVPIGSNRVLRDWSWWRSTLHPSTAAESEETEQSEETEEGAGARTRVLRTDDDTVTVTMEYDNNGGELFEPALTLLSADHDPGAEWEEAGTVHRPEGDGYAEEAYGVEGRMEVADDPGLAGRDCRAVTLTVTVSNTERPPRRLVLCPGLGIVADLAADERVTEAPAEHVPPPVPDTGPVVEEWQPTRWRLHRGAPESLAWPGPVPSERVTGGLVQPVQTEGGVLVRSDQDFALVAATGPAADRRVAWTVTPGDRILSLRAIGRVVVVSTGDRRLVGYDERGRWLWEAQRTDIVQAGALPVTETTFAVAGIDGGVEVRELATGKMVWTADVGSSVNGVSSDPADGSFHVLDDTGGLTAFTADSPEPRWRLDLAPGQAQLASSAGGVLVLTPNSLHRVVDGAEVWRRSVPFANWLAADEEQVYLVADRALRVLDVDSGERRWTRPGVRLMAAPGGENGLVVSDGARLTALDADGAPRVEVELPLLNQARLVSLADGVLAHRAPDPDYVSWEFDG